MSTNVTSIDKYEKREYPNIKNQFISRNVASELSKKIVNDFKDPKYVITVKSTLDPTLNVIANRADNTTVAVRSDKFFPKTFERYGKLRNINHDFRNMTTTLTLKDKNIY